MARTSRNPVASSMDALDNIDLDDMFADEGDALFDGLDIDLGNMDDITGAVSVNDDSLIQHAVTGPLHEQHTPQQDDATRGRRTNKRKIKSPVFFDDDEEDYSDSHKKKTPKKRQSKAAGPSKKSKTVQPADVQYNAVFPPPTAFKNNKKTKNLSGTMPQHPSQRGVVAAAGQFGGRNKRGLPKAAPVSHKSKPISAPPSLARVSSLEGIVKVQPQQPLSSAELMARIQATHPGLKQGTFCGLLPSNTLFYPFMPTLPNEPALKQRKLFPIVDRIHTSFLASVAASSAIEKGQPPTTASKLHPIIALMQECYKEDNKPSTFDPENSSQDQHSERAVTLMAAAGETRRTVSQFDRHQLAGDLMAVCALLKRQHDFLKQNKSNMDHWCKSHFTEEDYASVFLPPKPKPKRKAGEMTGGSGSILASFTKNQIRVKLVCSHFDETAAGPLYAALRLGSKITEKEIVQPKTKKAKLATSSTTGANTTKSGMAASAKSSSKSLIPYVEMKPLRRRKAIAELISKSARDLETKLVQRADEQRQIVGRQQLELQKVVDDDKLQMIHSTGMWRWLEKSGHFAKITDTDCQWRLKFQVVLKPECSDVHEDSSRTGPQPSGHAAGTSMVGSYLHRLQSLLIDGQDESDDELDDDDSETDLFDDVPGACSAIDLSALTLHERSFLHMHTFGLLENAPKPMGDAQSKLAIEVASTVPNAPVATRTFDSAPTWTDSKQTDELGSAANAMIGDLLRIEELNSMRATFLDAVSQMQRADESDSKAKNTEAYLISKCQHLVKKNKLERGKIEGKPKLAKVDELALPW